MHIGAVVIAFTEVFQNIQQSGNTAALPEWKLSLPTSIFAAKEIGLISFLMPHTVIFWKAGKKRL